MGVDHVAMPGEAFDPVEDGAQLFDPAQVYGLLRNAQVGDLQA